MSLENFSDEYLTDNADVMLGEVMKACIDMIKVMPDVWQKMGETQQKGFLDNLQIRVSTEIRRAVVAIAARDYQAITAAVDQVTFKDGVKVVMKLAPGSTGRHELADAEGDNVLIVLADAEQYFGGTGEVNADQDQPDLEYEDGDADPLYTQAVQLVIDEQRASGTWLQRQLKVGYNRACKLLETMERNGIVSREGSKWTVLAEGATA